MFSFSKTKSVLGIDIGTSNIKIAEVIFKPQPVLLTYGMVNVAYQLGSQNDQSAIEKMAGTLSSLIAKASANPKRAVISLPNNAVFTSVIELPAMDKKDLGSSVAFEAKKYVPLDLSEVDLNWTVISELPNKSYQILLTAVPKQITKSYMEMLGRAGVIAVAGEIEALALIRSLIGPVDTNCAIIDIGAKSTGLTLVEKGMLRLSRDLNVGGDTITVKIAQTLNISVQRAEQFKKDFGVGGATFIPETIKPILNIIKNEARQLIGIYQSNQGKVDKLILVGGGSNLPGIVEFFADLGLPVELGNPLKSISYSQSLEPILKRYSLSLAVALGLALRKI